MRRPASRPSGGILVDRPQVRGALVAEVPSGDGVLPHDGAAGVAVRSAGRFCQHATVAVTRPDRTVTGVRHGPPSMIATIRRMVSTTCGSGLAGQACIVCQTLTTAILTGHRRWRRR